jgi:hypothetical protein
MKDILKILLTLLLITAGSLTAADKKLVVRVSNPLNIERPGELVVVRWSSLQGKLASLEPANVAVYEKNGAVPIIRKSSTMTRTASRKRSCFNRTSRRKR